MERLEKAEQNPCRGWRRLDLGELNNRVMDFLGDRILRLYGVKVEEPKTTRLAPEDEPPTSTSDSSVSYLAVDKNEKV